MNEEARAIGERLAMIRRRRGLSQAAAAGLAGITDSYLSLLERGLRGFNRRGLLDDLAEALGCSVADLTGQPYHLADLASAEASLVLPEIGMALSDTTLDDVPDMPARPVDQLIRLVIKLMTIATRRSMSPLGKGSGMY